MDVRRLFDGTIPVFIGGAQNIKEVGDYITFETYLGVGRYIKKDKVNKRLKKGTRLTSQGITYTVQSSSSGYSSYTGTYYMHVLKAGGELFSINTYNVGCEPSVPGYVEIDGQGENPYTYPLMEKKPVTITLHKTQTLVTPYFEENGYSAYEYFFNYTEHSFFYGSFEYSPIESFNGWILNMNENGTITSIMEQFYS